MKRMGVEAIYRRPNTSNLAPRHKIYPYLLRNLPITRPNQVWAMDITYIPIAHGFIYLARESCEGLCFDEVGAIVIVPGGGFASQSD